MIESTRRRSLWIIWSLFFFQFAGIGFFFTFLNVYFREVGLSGTQIGLISTASAVIAVISSVLWGYLSDRTGQARFMLAISGLLGALLAQLIPFVHTFLAYLILGCLGGLLASSANTLIDSTTLVLLGTRREDYGRYRTGGSVGYICATFIAGFLYDWGGLKLMFPSYAVVIAGFVIVALLLPAMPVPQEKHTGQSIGKMMRRPAWILFAVCIFLCWMATNGALQFLGVAMNEMGSNQRLIGLAWMIPAIIEVPLMMQSGVLLRRFGAVKLLWLSMLILTIRFLLLGWMPSPVWAIPINTLNAPAFVFFWNSAVTYANKMAPPSLSATTQGLFASTISLAGMISALLSGWLFDLLGPNGVFYVLAVGCLAAFILFGLGQIRHKPSTQGV
jgi:PPP family 3-phenylpropionic acid transporter